MKNLKKVLALVLAFACAFTMFAGAVVYPDVPAGSEYSEAITMLSDLGIIQGKDDGKYHSEDTITRAEACALIARMLTGDPQVSQYAGASNFTDVVKGSWKESVVGYCVVNGITVGVGNNKFEPDRAITDAEFVTMVVRAMGYETTGTSYPYGHISAAQANGLLDDVTVVPSSAALRGEDAQIIYNALFADYARGAKQVNTTHGTTVEEYPTIAEDVFGLERAAVGTWGTKDGEDVLKNCKAHTWVITGKRLIVDGKTNMIEARAIDDSKTKLYDNKIYAFEYEGDIDGLKGYQVELWGEGQHGEPEMKKTEDGEKVYSFDWEIKAVKTVKGQSAYDFDPTMADDKENGTIKTDDYEVDLDNVQNFTESDKKIEIALNTKNSASYKLIDWDSDDSIDFIVKDIFDYYEVKSVSKKTVRLANFAGTIEFVLDTDGETNVTIDGQKYTVKADLPTDLEEDDVLQVSKSDVVGKKKIESTWTVEVVEPETKEITKITSKKGVEFDDEKIDVADAGFNFNGAKATYDALNEDSADNWDLWLDANGFIIKMEEADDSYAGYLFVTGAVNGRTTSTGSKDYAYISGVTDENKVLDEVKVIKDASVKVWDGSKYVSGYSSSTREFANNINIKGRVFKYNLNDDGNIEKLYEVACETKNANYSYKKDTRALNDGTNKWLQKASVIFAVEVKPAEWYDIATAGTPNVAAGCKLALGGVDIDTDNVYAVDYKDVPDIKTAAADGKTLARGVAYNVDNAKDEIKTVVLGVDSLNEFKSTSTKVALLTELDYNAKGDAKKTYDVKAYVNGMEETSFSTIAYDEMTVNGSTTATRSQLDKIHDEVKTNAKNAVYAELRFNKDGKVTAINVINDTKALLNGGNDANAAAQTEAGYNKATTDAHYTVVRAVVNLNNDRDRLMVAPTKGVGDDKVATVDNAGFTNYYKLVSDTAYYVIDADLAINDGKYLNAYKDGFNKSMSVADGDKADLVSYINSDNTDYEDEYCIADVVIDDTDATADNKDVVAVYYYKDAVEESGAFANGSLNLSADTASYFAQPITATVTLPTADYKAKSAKITVLKGDNEVASYDVVDTTPTVELATLPVGEYTVKATGYNTKARETQQIGATAALEIKKTQATVSFIKNASTETPVTSYIEGTDEVVVKVVDQDNVPVKGLTPDDFILSNRDHASFSFTCNWGTVIDGSYILSGLDPVLAVDPAGVTVSVERDGVLETATNGAATANVVADDTRIVFRSAVVKTGDTQKLVVSLAEALPARATVKLYWTDASQGTVGPVTATVTPVVDVPATYELSYGSWNFNHAGTATVVITLDGTDFSKEIPVA